MMIRKCKLCPLDVGYFGDLLYNQVDLSVAKRGEIGNRDVVDFKMTVQEAVEAPNFTSNQMRSSFAFHDSQPGALILNESMPPWVTAKTFSAMA